MSPSGVYRSVSGAQRLDSLAADLLERLRLQFHPWELVANLGLTIDAVNPGEAQMKLSPTRTVLNGAGGHVNGGVLATMADMACSLALSTAFDGAMPFATSDLHLRYLEPAKGEVRALANVVRVSRRGAVLECRLFCGEGLVAIGTAQFAIRQSGG